METRSVLSNECVQPNSTIKHSLRVSGTCCATWGSTDTCVLPRGMFRSCYTVLFIRPANRTRPSLREETLDLTSKYTLKSLTGLKTHSANNESTAANTYTAWEILRTVPLINIFSPAANKRDLQSDMWFC